MEKNFSLGSSENMQAAQLLLADECDTDNGDDALQLQSESTKETLISQNKESASQKNKGNCLYTNDKNFQEAEQEHIPPLLSSIATLPLDPSDSAQEEKRSDISTALLDDTNYDNYKSKRNQSETSIPKSNERRDNENSLLTDVNVECKDKIEGNKEKQKGEDEVNPSNFQEDPVFGGDLSKFPDQILAEPSDKQKKSDYTTLNDEKKSQKESSQTESFDNNSEKNNDSDNIGNPNKDNTNFEEIVVNEAEKDKSSHIEETDALSEDRTQIISEQNDSINVDECSILERINEADKSEEDIEMKSTDQISNSSSLKAKTKEKINSKEEAEKGTFEEVTVEKDNEELESAQMSSSNIGVQDGEDIRLSLQCDEQLEEGQIIEAVPNESEDVCLLPDEEKELTGAEKERAIQQACQQAEKEVEDGQERDETRVSTPIDETNIEEEQVDSATTDNETIDTSFLELREFEIKELTGNITEQKCYKCRKLKPGKYKLLVDGDFNYLCDVKCVNSFRMAREEQYTLTCHRIIITAIFDTIQVCQNCKIKKGCHYRFKNPGVGNFFYVCESMCLNDFIGKNIEKYLVRRKKYMVEELLKEVEDICVHCKEKKTCRYNFKQDDDILYVCGETCYYLLSKEEPERFRIKRRTVRVRDLGGAQLSNQIDNEPKIIARTEVEAQAAKIDRNASFVRRCTQCFTPVEGNERTLQWETIDFCNEICLGKYQNTIGSRCQSCRAAVPVPSLGKYCVRFGFEVRQFCCSSCLDCFKKGLKVCSLCQKDISKNKEGFLAPVGDKGQFKDFCSQECLKRYEDLHNSKKKTQIAQCAVCNNEKSVRVEIILDDRMHYFCSNPCFSAFKFVNNIVPDQCAMCTKFFERKNSTSFTIYQDKVPKVFCCKICMNLFIIMNRKIVPCQWCKVKKYNFDMIQKQCGPQILMLCSLNCLTLYGVSLNAISMRQQKCDQCGRQATPQYHLTMSDATIRNFCTYQCVMVFQSQFGRTPLTLEGVAEKEADTHGVSPFPTSLPKRIKQNVTAGTVQLPQTSKTTIDSSMVPVISNVESLATQVIDSSMGSTTIGNTTVKRTLRKYKNRGKSNISQSGNSDSFDIESSMHSMMIVNTGTQTKPPARRTVGTVTIEKVFNEPKTKIITVPPYPHINHNRMTMCKPNTSNKAVSCRPNTCNVQCQTEKNMYEKVIVPVPVPVYVPQPMYMYSAPFPIPVPIPLPIPVPIFIPTTRNSAAGIMKEIKKIQDKMPSNPYEADLLMMAEMVAGDKKKDDSDSDDGSQINNEDDFITETVEPANSFGEDMLQMALKMATEYEEPAVDLESAMATNTITPSVHSSIQEDDLHSHQMIMIDGQRQIVRGRKRVLPMDGSIQQTSPRNNRLQTTPPQKKRREIQHQQQQQHTINQQQIVEPVKQEPVEKPDANMCLKYTFGVNAWKQWVMTKNAEIEKSSIKRRPFKSELLQMTADELNYSLCLFVKEVRKPNGSEYAPDTIYYLVLGIQQYLYENGRIDNIFTDPYYERFTDCLDEVAKKFSILYNDSQYIVTRVEEEHLWECKQLGAHSPHVLLSTLMFFNTKHFNLTTVEEHMQLSFSHIMKHWKRSTPGAKTPGSRNVLLRFYPPQIGSDANPRKKKVYEQQENEENPLRCPVKLYEFYLSKCPESVKTRNDVFYLQPERSCVPDSPVWYSTQPLSCEALSKMLHRVKMVKEINIALLTS